VWHFACATRVDLKVSVHTKVRRGTSKSDYLEKVMSDIHTRTTRSHPLYLRAPFVEKSVPDTSFTGLAYRLWNNLKPNLCSTKSTATFRVNIESLLSKQYLRPKL
jgi:hypothetical protein